ncbi:MAG: CtsR family transcriptional regulator [Clostridia bacterium]|nr:CtsR family transcriptional regulator [Clostridia bacterium]
MANISDIIEQFILKSLGDDGVVEISRNDLASFFSCVPSQINYVLETRFTMDRGFIKESRRGGGGYIRISKVPINEDTYVNSLIMESIGDELTEKRANQILDKLQDEKILSAKERMIVSAGLSDVALQMPYSFKDKLRANIFKNILMYLLKDKGE